MTAGLLCVTAITFVVVLRNHTIRISPVDIAAATASQPMLGVRSGGTTLPGAEPAAMTKATAERILASYWQVNYLDHARIIVTMLATCRADLNSGRCELTSRIIEPIFDDTTICR